MKKGAAENRSKEQGMIGKKKLFLNTSESEIKSLSYLEIKLVH